MSGQRGRLVPTPQGLRDRRYWVEVRGDVAQYLDGMGLMVRCLDEHGIPKAVPTFHAEAHNDAAMLIQGRFRRSSEHLGDAPQFEVLGSKVESNLRGTHLTVTAEALVELVVPRVIDALRMSDPAVPGDVELGPVNGPELDVEDHLAVDQQPGVDDFLQRVDSLIRIENGAVPVDGQPGHDYSSSVGAPSGAVCDNSNPTDGDQGEGTAGIPQQPAAPDSPYQPEVQVSA